MGARVDRTREYLAPSDAIIVHTRRMLQDAVEAFRDGAPPPWQSVDIDHATIHALAITLPKDASWREAVMLKDPPFDLWKRAG
jgi:hypothetical protein